MSIRGLFTNLIWGLFGFSWWGWRRLIQLPKFVVCWVSSLLYLTQEMGEPFEKYETIADFGYEFNKDRQLRNIEDGTRFQFNYYNNRARDQRRYEALGEVITEHVYELLVKECGLEKHYVPVDAINDNEPFSFIFMSPGALQQEKLLLLVHGSGVVRAGQWARRLIINDCLDSGTQIPYIKRAMEEGYGVVVLNTNDNRIDGERLERERKRMEAAKKDPQAESTESEDVVSDLENPEKEEHESDVESGTGRQTSRRRYLYVRDNENPEDHVEYVWENFVNKSVAKNVFIVAHSYGGVAVVNLVMNHPRVLDRLSAVAFTDSVHGLYGGNQKVFDWFKMNCVNWVSSQEDLNARIMGYRDEDCILLSAGTMQHEMTSYSAFESVFTYFDYKLKNPDCQPRWNERDQQPEVMEASTPDVDDVDDRMSIGTDDAAGKNERDEELGGGTEAECAAPVTEDEKRSGSHKDDKKEETGTKLKEMEDGMDQKRDSQPTKPEKPEVESESEHKVSQTAAEAASGTNDDGGSATIPDAAPTQTAGGGEDDSMEMQAAAAAAVDEESVEAEKTGVSDPEANGTEGGAAKAADVEMPVRGSAPASAAEHGNAERAEQPKVQQEARGQPGMMPQRDGTAMETNGVEKGGEHRDDAGRPPAVAGKEGDKKAGDVDAEETAAADGGTGEGEAAMIDLGDATKDETDAASEPESRQEETGRMEKAELSLHEDL
ncbi:uncharacterized protein LOC144949301 isoform X1 [Lampetra fluviatilis]